jgi:hypothetical protein
MGANKQIYRVVERLEECFGHIDNSTRDYIFLFFTKKFLLFERLELSLLELRLSPPLLKYALILAARAEYFVGFERVEVGHLSERELHILHLFEVEGLHVLERLQVVKGDRRVRLYLLHERCDVGLIFKGKLELSCTDHVRVERELKFHILDVILVLIVDHTYVLSIFPVLNNHASAIGSVADTLLFQLPLNFSESLTSSIPGDQHISCLKPDTHETTAHSKVVILKGVPFGWVREF